MRQNIHHLPCLWSHVHVNKSCGCVSQNLTTSEIGEFFVCLSHRGSGKWNLDHNESDGNRTLPTAPPFIIHRYFPSIIKHTDNAILRVLMVGIGWFCPVPDTSSAVAVLICETSFDNTRYAQFHGATGIVVVGGYRSEPCKASIHATRFTDSSNQTQDPWIAKQERYRLCHYGKYEEVKSYVLML